MLTTILVVCGVLLVVTYPFTIGSVPAKTAPKQERAAYATRLAFFIVGVSVIWFGAAVSAFMLSRRLRREYEEESLQNLADLITSMPPPKNRKDEQVE
jgi:hypothetical protein